MAGDGEEGKGRRGVSAILSLSLSLAIPAVSSFLPGLFPSRVLFLLFITYYESIYHSLEPSHDDTLSIVSPPLYLCVNCWTQIIHTYITLGPKKRVQSDEMASRYLIFYNHVFITSSLRLFKSKSSILISIFPQISCYWFF